MAEHTIKAKFGVDTKGGKDALDDMERHGKSFSDRFGKLFALEPMGQRRGAHALSRLAEGFASIGEESNDALRSVAAFGRTVSTGIFGGAAVATAGALAEKYVEINTQLLEMRTSVTDISRSKLTTGTFEGAAQITQNFEKAREKMAELRKELATLTVGPKGGLQDINALVQGIFTGRTPGGVREEVREHLKEMIQTASADTSKLAAKTRELTEIEKTRYGVGQAQAAILQEELRHREEMGKLADESVVAGGNVQALEAEKEKHAEIVREITEREALRRKEVANQMSLLQGVTQTAAMERQRAEIANSGLSMFDQQLTASRAGITIAEQKLALAKEELRMAEQLVEATKNLSVQEREAAAAARERAQAKVEGAKAGVEGAAAGYAGGKANELERRAMRTPQQAYAEYSSNLQRYNALRMGAARAGFNPDMLAKPQMGELDYDPMRFIRANIAQGEKQRAEEGPMAGMTLREKMRAVDRQATHFPRSYDNKADFNAYWSRPDVQEAQQGMKALNYPGMATTPRMDVPLESPFQPVPKLSDLQPPTPPERGPSDVRDVAKAVGDAVANVMREFWGN